MTLPFVRCHTSLYFRYMQYFYVVCIVLYAAVAYMWIDLLSVHFANYVSRSRTKGVSWESIERRGKKEINIHCHKNLACHTVLRCWRVSKSVTSRIVVVDVEHRPRSTAHAPPSVSVTFQNSPQWLELWICFQ